MDCYEATSNLKIHVGKDGYEFTFAWDHQGRKGWHEIRFLKTGMLSRKSDVDRAQQTQNVIDTISKLGVENDLPEPTAQICFKAFIRR